MDEEKAVNWPTTVYSKEEIAEGVVNYMAEPRAFQ